MKNNLRVLKKRKTARAKKRSKSASAKASVRKQVVRDVVFRPSIVQMERSFERGTIQTASAFRTAAGW